MIASLARAEGLLRERAGDRWRLCLAEARALAEGMRYLPWGDRARLADEYCWKRARAELNAREITAVVGRDLRRARRSRRITDYARTASAVMAAALALLEEEAPEGDPCARLLLRLAQGSAIRGQEQELLEALAPVKHYPGLAILFLILHPTDSAASFAARDAFWTALLGG